jgi:uncharacterized protein YehS (DUF1456 family)
MKMDIDKIGDILGKHGFVKITLNKLPTWLKESTHEGFQINSKNEIVSFIANKGEIIFTNPDSDEMKKIKDEVRMSNEPSLKDIPLPPEVIKKEIPINNDTFINNLPAVFEGKRVIAFKDIEDFKKEYPKTVDRILLFQKTPKEFVKYLDKEHNRPYVEGNIMKQEANLAFLWTCNSKIDGWFNDINPKSGICEAVACWGSIKVDIDGKDTIVSGVGIDKQVYRKADNQPTMTIPEMMKNANTDLKKKCLADLGFNGDVYRGEV